MYQVNFSDLNNWLSQHPANTVNSAYPIIISNIQQSNLQGNATPVQGTLQYILTQNPTKFVSLRFFDNSIEYIPANCVRACKSLVEFIVPKGCTEIRQYAFGSCTNLASITIPDSVTSIGSGAFEVCTSLENITIPNSVTSIGSSAFEGCTSLASITIPNSVTTIGMNTFYSCTSLANITIPKSVTTIGTGAFEGCTSLASITIPNSVTTIGTGAFCYCTSLEGITIPNSVTSIGSSAFEGCTSLASVTIPNSVTTITSSCFNGCRSLTSITLPSSITSIEDYAFGVCTSLANITFPSSISSIDKGAFAGCSNLESVQFPYSFTELSFDSIGTNIFSNCPALTDVVVYDAVAKAKFQSLYESDFGLTGKYYVELHSITVAISDLNDALGFLPSGTVHTIKVTELRQSHLRGDSPAESGTLQYILQNNNTKQVILNEDDACYREAIVDMFMAFYQCSNLCGFIGFPFTVHDLTYCFTGCVNLLNCFGIPSSVTNLSECFRGCTSLTEVTLQIPVEKVADGTVNMTNAFQNCSSLAKVNVPAITVNETPTWNAWRIIPDATNHQASVQCFDYQGNAKFLDSSQQPQDVIVPYGNSTDLIAKIKTNLLSFANVTDEQIKKVMTSLYSFTKNKALDPDKKSFVLWGKEDDTTHKANFVTNLTLSGEVINDRITSEDYTWSSKKLSGLVTYPIGFIYMRPYRTPNPATLNLQVPEGCAWVDISSQFNGDYFRVKNPRYHPYMSGAEVTVTSRSGAVLTLSSGTLESSRCWVGDIVRYNGNLAYVTARTEETISGSTYNKTLTLDRELSIPADGKISISQGDAIQHHKHHYTQPTFNGGWGRGSVSTYASATATTWDMVDWQSGEAVRTREETRVATTFMEIWQVQEI